MSENPSQPKLFETPPPAVHPKERERVAQLIASDQSGKAVDVAKDIHKRLRCAASEALLLDAYDARLTSLLDRRLDHEAAALMERLREQYPSAGLRLQEWHALVAARHGDLSALLASLQDPSLAPEKQAAVAANVRRNVFDLRALAECPALAPEHPWRTAAAALHRAFEAVTSGPVAEDALLLAEVSRSSPLAPWKMLIRAIAAWYRHDDAWCARLLEAVEPDSAAARLAPPLRALLHQPQSLNPAGAALVNQAAGDVDSLRAILKRLDAAFKRGNQPSILQEIRLAAAACRHTDPALLERLKQHISVRAMLARVKVEKVIAALGGPSLKNAHFWRLLARATEETKDNPAAIASACSFWEEFRRHAVREGWLPARGPEVATLYLHMADQLRHVDAEDLSYAVNSYQRHFDGNRSFYQGQPPEIRALMSGGGKYDLYFLSPSAVLERACEADPCAENFQRWLRHAAGSQPGATDLVAERWSRALPHDIPPLLHLMQSAESRNALQKAFKLMERAEQIDALNPEVRRARLRLLVAMAVRHLRMKNPKLAGRDLDQIELLPQAQQGDRPAFLAALRFVWCLARNARPEADAAYAAAVRFLGDGPTTQFLFLEVERWCGRPFSALGESPQPTIPLFAAFGRVCVLGEDMGMPVNLIEPMPEQMMKELSVPKLSADPPILAALGEAAIRQQHFPFAYAVAGAGLAQGAEHQARFLFLRARSLPPWEEERRASCLAAASDLARRQHDSDLLRRIGEHRHESLAWLDAPEQAKTALRSDEIGRIIQQELNNRDFPGTPPDLQDDANCQCPACLAERGELPQELLEMIDILGPEAVAKEMAKMLGIGGKKKRRRRVSPFDTPF